MPKSAGGTLKPVRTVVNPPARARGIMRFERPGLGPHHRPVEHAPIRASNTIAKTAVRRAADRAGAIDSRKMHDFSNLD